MKEKIMRTKAILLKILMLAVFIPTAAFSQTQTQTPTQAKLYEKCMKGREGSLTPNIAESNESYKARNEAVRKLEQQLCTCEAASEMKAMNKARALGYDGSKAAKQKLKANPKLQKQIKAIRTKMEEEQTACLLTFLSQ